MLKNSFQMLWETTNQEPIYETIKYRKWQWIGHKLRKDIKNITIQSLESQPVGRRKQGKTTETVDEWC